MPEELPKASQKAFALGVKFGLGKEITEDDLHWLLGIGRFGQSSFECETLPRILREYYRRQFTQTNQQS